MKTTAIIVAAGAGVRMGGDLPKAFMDLAGKPMVEYSLEVFDRHPRVHSIVLIVPEEMAARAREISGRFGKVSAVAPGGGRRQDSVRIGLNLLSEGGADEDLLLVHDAARPLVEPDLIDRVLDAAAVSGAAVPGLPPVETVRRVTRDGSETLALGTLNREELVLVQTPQAFRRIVLSRGFEQWGEEDVTDEAALVERLGLPVTVVKGSTRNLKITTPEDLVDAARFLNAGRST